jgi:hypothetical protein
MAVVSEHLDVARPTGWRRALYLEQSAVDFDVRGFSGTPAATRNVLEDCGSAFLHGFNRELGTPAGTVPDLSGLAAHRRGFGVEGAAMAACLRDQFRPFGSPRRLGALHERYAERYIYLLHVGVGWAMAKLHRSHPPYPRLTGGLLGWLAYDGWGFCRGFFAGSDALRRWVRHPGACEPVCGIRYQGLGRSLWFRDCGTPERIARRIAGLPTPHAGDLWSGVGLAATYAGGVDPAAYPALRELSGRNWPALAQGAAFGAEAWRRSGHTPAHAVTAVAALAGTDVDQAARWTLTTRTELDRPDATAAGYQLWRFRVQQLAGAAG